VTLGSLAAGQSESKAQTPSAEKVQTKVVLLGTGTPRPYPDRSGPATAIVVGERASCARTTRACRCSSPLVRISMSWCQASSTCLVISSKPSGPYTSNSVRPKRVTVTAFRVPHGQWPEAFGYRFDTPGKSIVISGDTSPSEEIMAHCQPCDVLIHEVYSPESVLIKQLLREIQKTYPGKAVIGHDLEVY
jgi:Beta-lactamase superfamily domain